MINGTIIEFDGNLYRLDILHGAERLLQDMLNKCPKRVCIVRVDVRLPEEYRHDGGNAEISYLFQRVVQHYARRGIVISYLWVREQSTSHHPHYHCLIFFDGDHMWNGWSVRARVGETWQDIVQLTGDACVELVAPPSGGHSVMIRHPLDDQRQAEFRAALDDILFWSRYFAKTFSKGTAPTNVREFHTSRVPKDPGPLSFPSFTQPWR